VGAKVLLDGSNIRMFGWLHRLPLRRSPLSLLSHLSLEGTLVVVVDHPSVELSPLPGEDSVVDPHLEDSVDHLEEVVPDSVDHLEEVVPDSVDHLEDSVDHLEEVVPDSVVHHHLEEETLQLKLTNPKPSEMYFNNEFIVPLVSKLVASAVSVVCTTFFLANC
jgi:hypothetical protein